MTTLRPPPCKSSLQRALLLAALAPGESRLCYEGELAEDPLVMARALETLGAGLALVPGTLVVTGPLPERLEGELELGENATALRFLCALVGIRGGRVRFAGGRGLARRPLGALGTLLEAAGAAFAFEGAQGRVPFELRAPGAPQARLGPLALDAGTQGASGICCALAGSAEGGELACEGELSYVELSVDWLARFGSEVAVSGGLLTVPGGRLRGQPELELPACPSSACFLLAAAAGLGRELALEGLDRALRHPDLAFAGDLRRLGLRVGWAAGRLELGGRPRPGDHAFRDLAIRPDTLPPLAALLASVPGRHRLDASRKLREKESDRIAVLARGLAALGVPVEERDAGLDLVGGTRVPAGPVALDAAGDHRMAMAFLLAGRLLGREVGFVGPPGLAKSWPGFVGQLAQV